MKRIWMVGGLMIAACFSVPLGAQEFRPDWNRFASDTMAADRTDPVALGHPLSYWLAAIVARDPDKTESAFDAIVLLGPSAAKAVPELTGIVERPFVPIRLGADTMKEIHAKLVDIHLRAGALDGLGAIGPAASPAAEAVVAWGLAGRVAVQDERPQSVSLYVDLVGVDVIERMRAAGTLARFGPAAVPPVQSLIESGDPEKQKFAAAILSETAVPIAADLMASRNCDDRATGLGLLAGMWPVIDREHLAALTRWLECDSPAERLSANKETRGGAR